jgi:hypothetical protein
VGLRVCGLWKVSESRRRRRRRRKKRGWINFTCETGIGQIIVSLLRDLELDVERILMKILCA